jgi:hypothetical protein
MLTVCRPDNRRATKLILAVLLVATAVFAVPTQADAAPKGKIELVTKEAAAVTQGDSAWIAISWRARDMEVTDFRVTATSKGKGVGIAYPENTGDHTSLSIDSALAVGEIDFTALYITAPYDERHTTLDLAASWTHDGKQESKKYKVNLPLPRTEGNHVVILSESAGTIGRSGPEWLGIEWTGRLPHVDDVKMTVHDVPTGADVYYPGEPLGSSKYTSLYCDSTLVAGETDIARFLVDASALKPEVQKIQVALTYNMDDDEQTVRRTLSFNVQE